VLGHVLGIASVREMLRGRAGGCPSTGVEGNELVFLGQPGEDEHIAAHAGTFRFNQIQHGRGGDGGIEGVAALLENLQTRRCCQGLARGDHAISRQDLGACLRKPAAGAVAADGGEGFGLRFVRRRIGRERRSEENNGYGDERRVTVSGSLGVPGLGYVAATAIQLSMSITAAPF
jgi:hypothetical protein